MAQGGENAILIEHRGAVDWITLNRPSRLNAIDDEMTRALRTYFEDLYDDRECRVVVLRGAGRGFCSGLDLASEQTRRVLEDGIGPAMRVQRDIRNIMVAMRRCPQPIIGLLHGAATGGGFVLALACDIRIAADTVRMNGAFIKIGLGGCDVGASYFLPRLIGSSAASELLLTGRDLHANRALQLNLVSEVVSEDELESAVGPYVEAMLATAPLALGMTKEVLNINLDASGLEAALALEDRNQILLGQSADFREGATAFREKRPPRFQGR